MVKQPTYLRGVCPDKDEKYKKLNDCLNEGMLFDIMFLLKQNRFSISFDLKTGNKELTEFFGPIVKSIDIKLSI